MRELRRFDRRTLLAAALAGGGAAALGAAGRGNAAAADVELAWAAARTKPAGSDLGAIEHVVFLMQENRSFDHYFGTYPGVRGFDDRPNGKLGAFSQAWPGGRDSHLLPFRLNTQSGIGECTHDLTHDWKPQHLCQGKGDNGAFVATHTMAQYEGPEQGTVTMGYHTRRDIPFYYALADAFTICDNYHCSVMGPTHPNRLMSLSGTVDPAGSAGGPVLETNNSSDVIYSASWDTMPEVLDDAGVSWKVYNPVGTPYAPGFIEQHGLLISDAILPYFKQYSNPNSPLYQKAFLPLYPTDFAADVAQGTLPAVSWLIPPLGYDEHPPAAPAMGEWYTSQVLRTLMSNKAVWAKTVVFHTYDENDGFFDHVPPPVPPPGTAGEYLTVSPLPSTAQGVVGPVGLGFRVPMLVISPFSRGGHVASEVADHTSQLRFLEARFGVKAPNISAWRRKHTGDLSSSLHMGHADVAVPRLPSTARDQKAEMGALGCTSADLVEAGNDQPVYPVPLHQTMPRQEST